MKDKINYIILVLLIIIVFLQFFKTPEGISESEMTYRLKVHDLTQQKILLLKENSKLESKLNYFKDEIILNNASVDSSIIEQLDSMFTAYFDR